MKAKSFHTKYKVRNSLNLNFILALVLCNRPIAVLRLGNFRGNILLCTAKHDFIIRCKETVLQYESHIFLIIFVGMTDHRPISSYSPVTFLLDWTAVVVDTLTHIDELTKKIKKTEVSIANNFSTELQY